jgi:iron complex outermembrane recepter protein
VKRSIKACLLGFSALVPAAAFAQNATPADAGIDSTDIVVTARKREERLQDVPIAVTAYGTEEIKAQRIEKLADVAKLTPGLGFAPLFGAQNQLPIIRGAAQTFGALNVGVFLDGIYLSGKASADLELNDLQRIEIVKGPQSALYGRNTFAGAINYVTQRPTKDMTGSVELTGGDRNLFKGVASVSGPLSDTIRVRVGGFYRNFDGWYTSAVDGGKVDFAKSYGGIATVEWQPVDAFILTLRGAYSNENLGQPAANVIRTNAAPARPAGSPVGTVRNLLYIGQVPNIPRGGVTVNTLPVSLAATTASGNLPADAAISFYGQKQETRRVSGSMEYDFGNATLTSITAYFEREADFTLDGDNTICDITGGCPTFGAPFVPNFALGKSDFGLSSAKENFVDFSQELRVSSNGSGPVKWLMGVFYYNNKSTSLGRSLSPITAASRDAFGFPQITTTTESFAWYGSYGYTFGQVSLTGEMRYEYEKQRFRQRPTNPAVVPSITNPTVAPTVASSAVFDLKQDFRFVTPRVILDWKFDDNAMLYASLARGEKTGGFNTNLNIAFAQRTYSPESTWNYEAGLKTTWLGGRLLFNLSGYITDWSNQQVACQNPVTFGGSSTQRTYVCNVGKAKIAGLEANTVMKLNDWFTLSGNYAYTSAKYRAFVDDSLAAARTLAGLSPYNFVGRSLPYVPEHKFVVSPAFSVPLGDDWRFDARGDVSYQSKSFVRADNLQSFGARTVVDLRATVRSNNWSFQVFANNVFDDDTSTAGVRFFDSVNFAVASPYVQGADRRQIGATIGYKF